jgi:MFS family permease
MAAVTPAAGAAPGADRSRDWTSPVRAWYAVAVFNIALISSFIDRQILSLLVGPIKADLRISDTEMSLLMGFAFALFYVVVGIPIARLADVKSRRLIIGAGIALWSVMTTLCGMARNYWQLFIARVGIGVGESSLSPAAISMLSDMFPKDKLPLAVSVFGMGSSLGMALALLLGGLVINMVSGIPQFTLPLVGTLHSWQLTFFIVGLPGLLIAGLLFTIREPPRRGVMRLGPDRGGDKSGSLPIREILQIILNDRRTYLPIFLALALKSLQGFGISMWVPTFFIRTYGWDAGTVGMAQGFVTLIGAPLGMVGGGMLASWYVRRNYHDANMRVVLIAAVLVIPFIVIYPLMASPWLALVLYGGNMFFSSMSAGPAMTALQMITPNQMRAQILAMYYLVLNLVGYGLGPTAVALLTDYVFIRGDALNLSMSLIAVTLGPIAALITWYGLKPYGDSVARAGKWNPAPVTA